MKLQTALSDCHMVTIDDGDAEDHCTMPRLSEIYAWLHGKTGIISRITCQEALDRWHLVELREAAIEHNAHTLEAIIDIFECGARKNGLFCTP
jgi:hypothetical protein